MCPVQTSYSAEHVVATVGQRADLGLFDIISKAAEGSDINFGLAVVRGTGDDQAKLPSTTGQAFMGITEYTTAWAANASDVHLYQENREMNIVDFGRVYAICEDGCVPGDAVFYRHTTGTGTTIGAFRTDADTATADEVNGATWETTASAGGIAIINFRTGASGVAPLTLFDDHVALATATTLLTQATLYDTTAGATTSTLADGLEGQEKTLRMAVDGGDMVVTPANLFDATSLIFASVNDTCLLRFIDGAWHVISIDGAVLDTDIITVVATSGAIPLTAKIVLWDTTAGASTSTLAAGYEGQRMLFKMLTDGGDQVLTPASFVDGTTVTFDNADYIELMSDGTNWMSIGTPTATVA